MLEIRWHGRGGQGAFTAAKLLGNAASLYEGKFALAFPSFGPERRGAPIQAFTKIDHERIINRSEITKSDYTIFLDETLFTPSALDELKPDGKVIISSEHKEKYQAYLNVVAIPADSIAAEILHAPITNTAMLGALIGVSGVVAEESVQKAMAAYLPQRVLEKNLSVVHRAILEVQHA